MTRGRTRSNSTSVAGGVLAPQWHGNAAQQAVRDPVSVGADVPRLLARGGGRLPH